MLLARICWPCYLSRIASFHFAIVSRKNLISGNYPLGPVVVVVVASVNGNDRINVAPFDEQRVERDVFSIRAAVQELQPGNGPALVDANVVTKEWIWPHSRIIRNRFYLAEETLSQAQ